MIVKAPTGLYEPILPSVPTDGTSVIFTISNMAPPRSALSFNQIPVGVQNTVKSQPTYTAQQRRAAVGQLVLVNTVSKDVAVHTGQPTFMVGQTLEFLPNRSGESPIKLTGHSVESRHDLYVVDSTTAAIVDMNVIRAAAEGSQRTILDDIRMHQAEYDNLRARLNTIQKQLNEISRIVSGLNVMVGIDPSGPAAEAILLLNNQKLNYQANMQQVIDRMNVVADLIDRRRDEFNNIAVLVN